MENQQIKNHYWEPLKAVSDWVISKAGTCGSVLEIGPGPRPFALSTELVDWQKNPAHQGYRVHQIDINQQELPFADDSFDFVYTRHVIEDLYNPLLIIKEMSRVAKCGYIETPSPLAELSTGVDGGSPPWRGYIHHQHIVWAQAGRLYLIPKYPVIEHLFFGDKLESHLITLLNTSPLFWNTYFLWQDHIKVDLLLHDRDFKLTENYSAKLLDALKISINNTLGFQEELFD